MVKNPYSGKFIVIEGLDGSGLTTQAHLLVNFLHSKKIDAILTKEPTKNSSVSQEIENILSQRKPMGAFGLQRLFAQDRKEHLENVIIPSLKEGRWVVCDRYLFSSLAFGAETEEEMEEIFKLNENFLMPDLVIFIKVSPEICLKRIQKRGEEIKLFEKKEKLEKVFENYMKLTQKFDNFVIVDGEKSIDEVSKEIQKIISEKFKI